MERTLEPEWLDELAPDDRRAVRSRHDLRRVNSWMGNVGVMTRALLQARLRMAPRRVVDLGAGDGTFLLRVARRLPGDWQQVEAVLVDRQQLVEAQTWDEFRSLGWTVQTVQDDASVWLEREPGAADEILLANLFVHHLPEGQLRPFFRHAARRSQLFLACDPRRSRLVLTAARMLGLIGCNAVTRHDGVISVRGGFRGRELSSLWPAQQGWELSERPAGPFSHLFQARRTDLAEARHD